MSTDTKGVDTQSDPQFFLNADDRGGPTTNGKPSLTVGDAGTQISRTGVFWGPGLGQAANVTYAFRSTAPTTMPSDTGEFARFTQLQIAATLLALQAWSDVANITFTRVADAEGYSNDATMLFGSYGTGAAGSAAFAYYPNNRAFGSNSGDLWVNASLSYNATPVLLGYGLTVLTHELGHAIGLSHPAAYNAAEGVTITYAADATYYEDSRQYTIMSYFSASSTGAVHNGYSAVPLLDDIAAAQRLYGANLTTRTGNTIYGFNSNADRVWFSAASASTQLIFAVWDAGGVDTFDFSGYSQNQVIDLRQGAFSNVGSQVGNVAIALGAVIENAIGGSGADAIYGNSADNTLTGGLGNDTIDGGLGADIVIFSGPRSAYTITWNGAIGTVSGPEGVDRITNVEFLRFSDRTIPATPTGGLTLSGANGADTLTGTEFADTLSGNAGNDLLYGSGGNDILNGGAGSDYLDGGSGIDAAIYAGLRLEYSASKAAISRGPEGGTDTLVSIEEARFVDGVLSFDVDGAAAQIMRLYDAALDRSPDQGGLDAHVAALNAGASLQQLASGFVNGSEFQSRYGALSNQAFVEQLYRFCLNREGDPEGIQAWTNALNAGMPRTEALVGFSESGEHRGLTAAPLTAGLWVSDATALTIARLYDATFDRLPDTVGLTNWVGAVKSGLPLLTLAETFAGSNEFQARYGTLSTQAFVEQLYRFCLNREGDPPGIQNWVTAINAGLSRASVLLQFSEGSEHVGLTASSWAGGIQYFGYSGQPAGLAAEGLSSDKVASASSWAIDEERVSSGLDHGLPDGPAQTFALHLTTPADTGGASAPFGFLDDDFLLPESSMSEWTTADAFLGHQTSMIDMGQPETIARLSFLAADHIETDYFDPNGQTALTHLQDPTHWFPA